MIDKKIEHLGKLNVKSEEISKEFKVTFEQLMDSLPNFSKTKAQADESLKKGKNFTQCTFNEQEIYADRSISNVDAYKPVE